jgi:hypothetical protein
MPYLGAGVDQHVNTTPVPTWVFTPNPVGGSSVRLYNEGTQPVYVGGANVSPFNGLPIWPGSRPVEIQNANGTVYTCSAISIGATANTITAASTVGQTTFTTSAAPAATLAAGSTFVLGTAAGGGGQEVLVVASTSASSVVTTTTGALFSHQASSIAYAASTTPGQLRVTAGVV